MVHTHDVGHEVVLLYERSAAAGEEAQCCVLPRSGSTTRYSSCGIQGEVPSTLSMHQEQETTLELSQAVRSFPFLSFQGSPRSS